MDSKILLYVSLSVIIGAYGRYDRIIGGQDADRTDFPYLVSFRITYRNLHFCAGTIITSTAILTAAHCITGTKRFLYIATAHTGATNITDLGSVYGIRTYFLHPNFSNHRGSSSGYHNDIAIVLVKGTILLNRYQNIINLPTRRVSINDDVILSGWGLKSFPSENNSDKIQFTTVKIENCSDHTGELQFKVLEDQICSHRAGVGACIGDSGGPVVKDNEIVGIISYSKPCATNVPDIHTDVLMHMDFITLTLNGQLYF